MKANALVLFSLIVLVFPSCSSVDKDALLGAWQVDHLEFSDKLFDTPAAQLISDAMRNRNYKFRKKGKVTFKTEKPERRFVGKWKWINNLLRLSMNDDYNLTEAEELGVVMHKFEVIKLNSSEMQWILKLKVKRLSKEEVVVVLRKKQED